MISRKEEKRPAPPSDADDPPYTSIGSLPLSDEDEEQDTGFPGLAPLKPESTRALKRLARYRPPKDIWPMKRRAAVLVALFGGRHGVRAPSPGYGALGSTPVQDLYVVLSRRSSRIRTYVSSLCWSGTIQHG